MTSKEVLEIKFYSRDLNSEVTIRKYLTQLLLVLWQEGDQFTGKRPLGSSGWKYDIYTVLVVNGVIQAPVDEDGDIDKFDEQAGDQIIESAIQEMGKS